MSRLPGRGTATVIKTVDGTYYCLSSTDRGFMATVDGGMRWFRPARIQAPKMSSTLATPQSRVPSYSQGSVRSANKDWWIADHLSEDRFDGAEVTVYRESAGVLGAVLDNGYVKQRGGVQADDEGVTFTYTDVLGDRLPGKTIGGRVNLDVDTFPNMQPPQVVAVTMSATGSAPSSDIAKIAVGINTTTPYLKAVPYAGPWPAGPTTISGITAQSNRTVTVSGFNASNTLIFIGQATGVTIDSTGRIQLWVAPDDVDLGDASAPTSINNPDAGKAIPVFLGQYPSFNGSGGTTDGHHLEAGYYVPAFIYDWGQANPALFRCVYEDLYDPATGGVLNTSTAGNNDVLLIDTQPPTSLTNDDGTPGDPITLPRVFTDLKTSIDNGWAYYLRKDGTDTVPGGLITWHAPGGPGGKFGTFDINVTVFKDWAQALFKNPNVVFDPNRFKILTQAGGAKCTDAAVQAAVPGMNAYRFAGFIARLLVNHGQVPAAKLDLTALRALDDLKLPKMRRYFTQPEDVATIYAAACQEAGVLSFKTRAGLISWKKTSLTAPPPAAFRFDEARCIAGSMSYASNDWGPYFNAASGITDQGLPYQPDDGKITVGEIVNADAIAANRGIKVSAPNGPIVFLCAYDTAEMKASIRETLTVQGLPSDTYHAVVRGIAAGGSADTRDVNAADALVVGDTIAPGYIASRIDPNVRRLLPKGSNALLIGLDQNPDSDTIEVTFWKFGGTAANKGQLLAYDPALHTNPAELGGGPAPTAWDKTKPDAWKAYWSNASGSGVGGWASNEGTGKIVADDASPYAYSLVRGS